MIPGKPSAPSWIPSFAPVADPLLYVPRPATERALDTLERTVLEKAASAVLLAQSGLGKTLLLRVLAGRVCDRVHPVYLPHPGLSQSELCAFALALAGRRAGGYPEVDLLSYAGELRRAGSALLLLVDDASGLEPAVARGLAGLAAVSHGGVRLVLAALDDARGLALADLLAGASAVVILGSAMEAKETADYVRGRLGPVEADDPLARLLAPDALARIHALSEGVPGRVAAAIEELLDAGG